LPELVERVGLVMKGVGESFELILVNDCSPDEVTWPAIEKLAAEFEWVRGIDLFFNAGQFRATLCGLSEAKGDFVITMDDDLQHPPEEIPKLIDAIKDNPKLDCVFGKYETKRHSGARNLGSKFFVSFLNCLYGKPQNIQTTSFRIIRKELAEALVRYRIAHPQPSPMIVLLTKKVANVLVRHDSRKQGSSNYTFFRLFYETVRSLINISVLPLRAVSLMGLIFSVISFGVGLFYFIEWCLGGIGVAGFTSLIIANTFFGGLILLSIGVLGEYVGRVIQEVSGPTGYSIRAYSKQAEAN
jgi:glycosyltransferase involved in cell wall biosynthesis